MSSQSYSSLFLPLIEDKLQAVISHAGIDGDDSLVDMLRYHFGWTGEGAGKKAQGKRIRPLFLLLVTEAVGGKAQHALPGAAAVEILHNFSLIHDDIEDNSATRRGRVTLWKLHGVPLAINAGDTLFTLAFQALDGLIEHYPPETCLNSHKVFAEACLTLTKGQHLDISFENTPQVQVDEYLMMIKGKTAALLSSSAELGALLGGAPPELQKIYCDLGKYVGLAFQIHDDLLGIWGDPEITGKSNMSDLITRKKTLPILYGLAQKKRFAQMWEEEITALNAPQLADVLQEEGAYDYTKSRADKYTRSAISALEAASPTGPTAKALSKLIHSLIERKY